MPESIGGTIHGKTIELDVDPGLTDGEKVEITIRAPTDARIAALRKTAGAMADDPEFDAAMAEVERARKTARDRESAG